MTVMLNVLAETQEPSVERLTAAGEDPETALWAAFWTQRDRESRNALVLAYGSIADSVVARLPSAIRGYWETGDLRSFGLLGLIEAIDRFDEDSSISRFPAYATKRVRGAIFDELRRLDWLPRTARRRVISYWSTVDSLSSELRRAPSRTEVFGSMNVDSSQGAAVLLEVQSAQLLHLDHGQSRDGDAEDETAALGSRISSDRDLEPEPQLLASEQLTELREAISGLPERQRTVVTLHFLAGLTQGQIGDMLGVSNSRVCQIEASAMQALRRVLERGAPARSRRAG